LTRKILTGVLAGALLLAVPGVAFANAADTVMNLGFKTSSKSQKAGTAKKPRPASISIAVTQSTKSGSLASTSKALNITLPKEQRFIGKTWPKKLRCDPVKANQAKSDSVCPKGSKLGAGHVTAAAGDGSLKSEIDVRAYVTKSGDLGLWLDALKPLPIHEMLIGKVTGGRTIKVAIPGHIQQPLVGVRTAIDVLQFSLNKGVESTGCPASKKWSLKFQNVYTDGSQTKTATAPCRR
jgi:hypothetical protein